MIPASIILALYQTELGRESGTAPRDALLAQKLDTQWKSGAVLDFTERQLILLVAAIGL